MNTRSFLKVLLLGGTVSFATCDLIDDVIDVIPLDCGYELQEIPYSDPAECEPELLEVFGLDAPVVTVPADEVPPLGNDSTGIGRHRILTLDGIDDNTFVLHVYKGAPGDLLLRVYGEVDCDQVNPITAVTTVSAVATRIEVSTGGTDYRRFYVRISLDATQATQPLTYTDDHFIALTAYEDGEPGRQGGIRSSRQNELRDKIDPDEEAELPLLPFACRGWAFQRLLLYGCEQDEATLRALIDELGVVPSEEYYGPKGSVVVFDVPPGMDLDATGGAVRNRRAEVNGEDIIVESDFIVNLFSPRNPTVIVPPAERVLLPQNDPEVEEIIQRPREYFQELLPPFQPREEFGNVNPPLLVTIIDSGVDLLPPNRELWEPTRYDLPLESEYVKSGNPGFDFIAKDIEPNDLTPHGTHVAGALIGQYRSERPLKLLHMKVFGQDGISTYFGALVSIYEAAVVNTDIINMSWGIATPDAPEALACAVQRAVDDGIFIVTSAGNDTLSLDADPQWPAAFAKTYPDHVIAVASYWYRGNPAGRDPAQVRLKSFSNFGPSIVPVAEYMTTPVREYQTGNIIFPLGTSISTPMVAGKLANLLADEPTTDLNDFRAKFYENAPPLSGQIVDENHIPLPE